MCEGFLGIYVWGGGRIWYEGDKIGHKVREDMIWEEVQHRLSPGSVW